MEPQMRRGDEGKGGPDDGLPTAKSLATISGRDPTEASPDAAPNPSTPPPYPADRGTGYVGARLLPLLEQQACRLRCLARRPAFLRTALKPTTEIVQGDVLEVSSLDRALQGVHTAYYLVHLMAGSQDFAPADRQGAATHCGGAARAGG